MIRILVDDEDDRAAVLAAMEGGRLTDLLLHPFVVAWNHGTLLPSGTDGEDPTRSVAEGYGA